MRSKSEIRSLTGLRGVAAAGVVTGHLLAPFHAALRWISFENAAVDIFFCLSGFTLSLHYRLAEGTRIDWRSYGVARFARVYPLYVILLAIAWWYTRAWNISEYDGYTGHKLARDVVRQVFMVNAWPVIGSGAHWVAPMWSLSIEFFCYLVLFPAAAFGARRLLLWPSSVLLSLAIALAFTCYVVTMRFYVPQLNEHHLANVTLPWQAHWVALSRGVTMFTSGWLAYLIWAQNSEVSRSFMSLATCLAWAMILILLGSDLGVMDRQQMVWLTPLFVLSLMNRDAWVSRLLSTRPIHALGVISYSVYLTHWSLFVAMRTVMRNWGDDRNAIAAVLLTIVVAPLSYTLIERPARILIRQWFARPSERGLSGLRASHPQTADT